MLKLHTQRVSIHSYIYIYVTTHTHIHSLTPYVYEESPLVVNVDLSTKTDPNSGEDQVSDQHASILFEWQTQSTTFASLFHLSIYICISHRCEYSVAVEPAIAAKYNKLSGKRARSRERSWRTRCECKTNNPYLKTTNSHETTLFRRSSSHRIAPLPGLAWWSDDGLCVCVCLWCGANAQRVYRDGPPTNLRRRRHTPKVFTERPSSLMRHDDRRARCVADGEWLLSKRSERPPDVDLFVFV